MTPTRRSGTLSSGTAALDALDAGTAGSDGGRRVEDGPAMGEGRWMAEGRGASSAGGAFPGAGNGGIRAPERGPAEGDWPWAEGGGGAGWAGEVVPGPRDSQLAMGVDAPGQLSCGTSFVAGIAPPDSVETLECPGPGAGARAPLGAGRSILDRSPPGAE